MSQLFLPLSIDIYSLFYIKNVFLFVDEKWQENNLILQLKI